MDDFYLQLGEGQAEGFFGNNFLYGDEHPTTVDNLEITGEVIDICWFRNPISLFFPLFFFGGGGFLMFIHHIFFLGES